MLAKDLTRRRAIAEASMGFNMALLVYLPRGESLEYRKGDEETPFTLFELCGSVHFGRITREEKITGERFKHLSWSAREQAAICSAGAVIREVFKDELGGYAPPFLGRRTYGSRRVDHLPELCPGAVRVEPLWKRGPNPEEDPPAFPTKAEVLEHNRLGTMNQEQLRAALEDGDPLAPPFKWVPARDVATWLHELTTSGKSESWPKVLESKNAAEAAAHVEAWQGYLAGVGKLGAYCLPYFNRKWALGAGFTAL